MEPLNGSEISVNFEIKILHRSPSLFPALAALGATCASDVSAMPNVGRPNWCARGDCLRGNRHTWLKLSQDSEKRNMHFIPIFQKFLALELSLKCFPDGFFMRKKVGSSPYSITWKVYRFFIRYSRLLIEVAFIPT